MSDVIVLTNPRSGKIVGQLVADELGDNIATQICKDFGIAKWIAHDTVSLSMSSEFAQIVVEMIRLGTERIDLPPNKMKDVKAFLELAEKVVTDK